MHVLISGASGLVGTALSQNLRAAGHDVSPLEREKGATPPRFVAVPEADAVVHLAGENLANGRWTAARKERFRTSRVDLTKSLVAAIGAMQDRPKTLVCASAIGFYGDRGEEELDETSAKGEGFLADLCADWEAAAREAEALGVRVVCLRIGIVLAPDGGALAKMLTPFKLGLGGPLGNGRQFMSWVHIDDLVGLIAFAVEGESLTGAVNGTAPHAVTNREFTKTLGRVLRRPTILPVPGFALRLLFGEMADEALLASARVRPRRAQEAGFAFRYSDLEGALRNVLADGP